LITAVPECIPNILPVSFSTHLCTHSLRTRMQLAIAVLIKVAASGSNLSIKVNGR
jgi:hypothetical protein